MKSYINNHMTYKSFKQEDNKDQKLLLEQLKLLIDNEQVIDKYYENEFPISYFGASKDTFAIEFGGNVFNLLLKIKDNKIDIIEKFKYISFIGLDNSDELILEFYNPIVDSKPLVCNCIYDSTFDFLELISMGKYGASCIKNDQIDILRENLDYQIKFHSEKSMKYRLIERQEKHYLRAVVSEKYHNYNNNLCFYLTMGLLHKMSLESKIKFSVNNAQMSDSGIQIFIESDKEYIISNFAKVKLGLFITNGELRDKTFSCRLRYTVFDLKNHDVSFNFYPSNIEDTIFDIKHTLNYDTAKSKILYINELLKFSDSMISHISNIKNAEKLDSDTLFSIFANITKDKTGIISGESKKSFRELYDKTLTQNSYSIIEAFDLMGKMFTHIDERLFLEKVYYDVLIKLSKN